VQRALASALAAAVLALGGCGGGTLRDDAETAGSIAAEGALLAHDVADGSTTHAFARVHARALREKVEPLAGRPQLAPLARDIARQLERIADDPGETAAADAARALERAAARADRLAR
jgi:hypothetical protein